MSDDERRQSPLRPDMSSTDRHERARGTPPSAGQANDRRRSRSRSPAQDKKPRRKDGGFKWKEKRRTDDDPPSRDRDDGLRRGYSDTYKPSNRSRSPRRRDYSTRDRERDRDLHRRGRDDRDGDPREERPRRGDQDTDRPERKPKKETKPTAPAPAMPPQEMILVTVNDRLGTKKQIPCLPSDTIKDFKAVVAMMIGRRPHEILLKRQSERPFKDFLTLQDYGISNNVQLDLEVDTGD